MKARFVCIVARAPSRELAEHALAEAFGAGASGVEERTENGDTQLLLYAPAEAAEALRRALEAMARPELELAPTRAVEQEDWAETWRAGLQPLVISPRLAIRPSSQPFEAAPGQTTLVIDPGQAFGTGGHASTRLVLELLDELANGPLVDARVLDVGCGSGILALAALGLGARSALGFDLDPLAARETRDNARRNRCEVGVFCGGFDALAARPFDVVVANLLRLELLPVLPALAAATRVGGFTLVSGLLVSERAEVEAALGAVGLRPSAARSADDPTGDRWLALVARRTDAPEPRTERPA